MKKKEFKPTNYPSDLTDAQWEAIAEYLPQGPNSEHHKRSLINGVLYLVNNGCKWRALPHDYPPYSTVHSFYRRAMQSGLWERVLRATVKKPYKSGTECVAKLWHNRLAERQDDLCE